MKPATMCAFAHLYRYIKAFAILALEMNALVMTTCRSGLVGNTTRFQLEVKLSGFIYPVVLYPLHPLTVKSSATPGCRNTLNMHDSLRNALFLMQCNSTARFKIFASYVPQFH